MTEAETHKWRITLFGTLTAECEGQRITRFQTQKTALVFAYLAINPGQELLREVLCDTFWPDSEPEAARASLNQAIASIRKSFGTHDLLITDRRYVAVDYDRVEVDVEQFRALIHPRPDVSVEARQANLTAAVALYSDKLLTGISESWVRIERLMLSEKYLKALAELGEIEESNANYDEAIHWQQEIVRADPKDEAHHQKLLRLYAITGNLSAARRHYQELLALLSEDGRSPSHETRAVVEQIVEGGQAGVETAAPSRLPNPLTKFYGREDLIRQVSSMLHDGARLITFVGLPGIGKTRLAIEIAHQETGSFEKVAFIPLADVSSNDGITSAIGEQVGWIPSPNEPGLSGLLPRLAYGGNRLLVLDNLDHLLPKGVEVVHSILQGAPNVTIIATSQSSLGLSGEQKIPIDPLPVPNQGMTVDELTDNPSFSMLLDRIRAVVPAFAPAQEEAVVMADLCRQLEGFPLALELAAARAESTSVTRVLAAISDSYEILSGHSLDVPDRHQSLESSFQHCFSLLPNELRRMLGQLSIFEGGWTWDAVDQIVGSGTAQAMAKGLLARALITPRPQPKHCTDTRFEMLDLLRHYSAGQIDAAEREELLRKHAATFASVAHSSKLASLGAGRTQWVVRLGEEAGNIALALDTLEKVGDIRQCLCVATDLGWYWTSHGSPDEYADRLSRYLDGDELTEGDDLLAEGYLLFGNLHFLKSSHDQAQQAFARSLALSRLSQNRVGIAQSLNGLGAVAIRKNEHALAKELLAESISISDAHEDVHAPDTANNHLYLAFVLTELEEYEAAKRQFDLYVGIESRRGNMTAVAKAFSNLSHWARFQGRYELATHYAHESLRIYEGLDQVSGVARASLFMAQVLVRQGKHSEASGLLHRSIETFDSLGDPLGVQYCVGEWVRAQASIGAFELAAQLMAIESDLASRIGALRSPADESDYAAVCRVIREHVGEDKIEAFRIRSITKSFHEIAAWVRSIAPGGA